MLLEVIDLPVPGIEHMSPALAGGFFTSAPPGKPNLKYTRAFLGEGNDNPLRYSCLENPMEGRAWQATVHGVAKSRTRSNYFTRAFLGGTSGKDPACQCSRCDRSRFDPWIGKILQGRVWQPTSVFLTGESHGQKSLAGYRPLGRKESDTTEAPQHTACTVCK